MLARHGFCAVKSIIFNLHKTLSLFKMGRSKETKGGR